MDKVRNIELAKEFANETDLSKYLSDLAKELKVRHEDCDCDQCRFDATIITGIERIQSIFDSQILLLKNGRPSVSDLLVRPIMEFVTDMLFIELDVPNRIGKYLAFDANFERFRLKRIKEFRKDKGKSISEVTAMIKQLEKFMADERLQINDNPSQWTEESPLKKHEAIVRSDRFGRVITESIRNHDMELRIRFAHSITHFSSYHISRSYAYEAGSAGYKDSLDITIDWIMRLLEFIKVHFDKPDIDEALLKYFKLFYQ